MTGSRGGAETGPARRAGTLSGLKTLMEDKRPFHGARWRWDGTEDWREVGLVGSEQSVTSDGGERPPLSPLRDALTVHNDAGRRNLFQRGFPTPREFAEEKPSWLQCVALSSRRSQGLTPNSLLWKEARTPSRQPLGWMAPAPFQEEGGTQIGFQSGGGEGAQMGGGRGGGGGGLWVHK